MDESPLATSRKDTFYRLLLNELDSFYFDQEGNTVVNSEASIKAMKMVKKIYDAGITGSDNSWDDYVREIKTGKVATIPEAVWLIGTLKDITPELKGQWGVMRLPVFDTESKAVATNGGSVK